MMCAVGLKFHNNYQNHPSDIVQHKANNDQHQC